MENGPFILDFPIKTTVYRGFSMAMFNNQMAIWFFFERQTSGQHLRQAAGYDAIQWCLVDCPGHASLIRTVIGGPKDGELTAGFNMWYVFKGPYHQDVYVNIDIIWMHLNSMWYVNIILKTMEFLDEFYSIHWENQEFLQNLCPGHVCGSWARYAWRNAHHSIPSQIVEGFHQAEKSHSWACKGHTLW